MTGEDVDMKGKFAHLVSDVDADFSTPVKINQDANIHVAVMDSNQEYVTCARCNGSAGPCRCSGCLFPSLYLSATYLALCFLRRHLRQHFLCRMCIYRNSQLVYEYFFSISSRLPFLHG